MRVLVVSPHYDDAPLSLGQSMLDGELSRHTVTVGVVFGRSNYTRYFRPTRRRWPLASGIRLAEELRNARRFGYRLRLARLPEVILRTGSGDSSTFLSPDIDVSSDGALSPVIGLLRRWSTRYDQVVVPMGVGDHLDHRLVAEAGRRLSAESPGTISFYEDRPYASWISDDEIEPVARRVATDPSRPLERRDMSGPTTATKQTTIWYPSQFHPSFIDAMAGDIAGARREHVWTPPTSSWPPADRGPAETQTEET